MELSISIAVFFFGILTWTPFLNGVYGHDLANCMYLVERSKKKDIVFYKDFHSAAIGHFLHIMFMQYIFKKENTKAFYGIMCLYCSISAFVLFWVLSIMFGPLPAILGSMLFSLYIVSPRLEGNWGPFEQLMPLPLFISMLCILVSSSNHSHILIFLSGMALGYAVLVKQIAVLYLPGYFLLIFGTGHSFYDLVTFLLGFIISNLIPLIYYWLRHDALWEYLICNWLHHIPTALNPKKFNKLYPKIIVQGEKDKKSRKHFILKHSRSLFPIVFLSIIGAVVLFACHFSILYIGLFLCLISSISMIFMRGTFFGHYWLNMIPWLAIFAGFGFSEIIQSSTRSGPPTAGTIAGILAVVILFYDAVRADIKYYIFSKDSYKFLKNIGVEGLADCYKNWERIGEYLKNTTKKDDRILVCGWIPHVLLYSDRVHFTKDPYLYTEDCLDIYSSDNPTYFGFLKSIFNFKRLDIFEQAHNIFHEGYPEIIIFDTAGKIDIEGFEKLTGIKYSLDENAGGYPLFRADLILTELMFIVETQYNFHCLHQDNRLGQHRAKITEMIDNEELDEFIKILKMVFHNKFPKEEYLLLFGDSLIKSGKHKLMVNFYNRLIENNLVHDGMKLKLLNKIGESYYHQNRFSDAENTLRYVLHFDPDNVPALNNLGVLYYNQDKSKEAINCFQNVLEIESHNEDAIINLERIQMQQYEKG